MTAPSEPVLAMPLWLRALSRLPLPVLYGVFGALALAGRFM